MIIYRTLNSSVVIHHLLYRSTCTISPPNVVKGWSTEQVHSFPSISFLKKYLPVLFLFFVVCVFNAIILSHSTRDGLMHTARPRFWR